MPLPVLGRRRSWILLTQVGLLVVIAALGGFAADRVARHRADGDAARVLSATQDIALDAYRRELLADN